MGKPLSWNEIRVNATEFAARWADDWDEKGEAQTFWNEFLSVFGVDRKRVATFEKRAARKSTGGRGFIDLLWSDVMACEHKTRETKDEKVDTVLQKAEDQALDYLDSLTDEDLPRYIVTSDFGHLRILDLVTGEPQFTFQLKDLPLQVDRFGFIAGYQKRDFSAAAEQKASIEAAKLMGALYERLAAVGYADHESNILLTRMLFLLFGDDTGLWERGLFQWWVETRTGEDGTDFGPQLAMLFQTLNTPESKRPKNLDEMLARFPYVNGDLYAASISISAFDKPMRDVVLQASAFDWGGISPAIFGSMFQSVKAVEARRALGEYYTREENILRVIRPLFMDDLHAEFEASKASTIKLNKLRARLGQMRFLDPACGCGNFLVVAYRELRRLELAIMVRLAELDKAQGVQQSVNVAIGMQVTLTNFHGIELEEWPAQIARTAMFLADHQENLLVGQQFGQAISVLPLTVAADIRVGNATDIGWAEVCPPGDNTYVLGNPPFVGMAMMTAGQQADRTRVFNLVPGGERTGRLDYVTCWYALAIRYLKGTHGRCAFVSTNSVTQGEQARTLGPFLKFHGFEIDFAHRTFAWTSEAPRAAHVHVVIVGFSEGGVAATKHLFDYPNLKADPIVSTPKAINIYLAASTVAAIGKHRVPIVSGLPKLTEGNRPQDGGGLIVTEAEYPQFAADPIASKYLRRLIGTKDTLHGWKRWCLWMVGANPADIPKSQLLQDRLAIVSDARNKSPTESAHEKAKTPSLFFAIRQPTKRWLFVPRHSSEGRVIVPMAFFGPNVIPHDSALAADGADEYVFGVLQSSMFDAWIRTVSGYIKSDVRVSPDLSYNSFPFPSPDAKQRQRVADAAQAVLDARAQFPDLPLADMYDPLVIPPALVKAHKALDSAVDACYGRRVFKGQAARLAVLFAAYEKVVAQTNSPTV